MAVSELDPVEACTESKRLFAILGFNRLHYITVIVVLFSVLMAP